MPVQQLRLYDIIVDLLPGVLFLALLYPLTTENTFNEIPSILSNASILALILLACGYILGRLIHSTTSKLNNLLNDAPLFFIGVLILESSVLLLILQSLALILPDINSIQGMFSHQSAPIENDPGAVILVIYLLTLAFTGFVAQRLLRGIGKPWKFDHSNAEFLREPELISRLLPVEEPDSIVDDWLKGDKLPIISSSDQSGSMEKKIIREIQREMANQYRINSRRSYIPGKEKDFKWVRFIGYSELFGKETLYHRYNILTTFFRNISVVFWSYFIMYSIINFLILFSNSMNGIVWSTWDYGTRYLITWLFLLLGVIFSTQVSKYSRSRNRQFIADLYTDLISD